MAIPVKYITNEDDMPVDVSIDTVYNENKNRMELHITTEVDGEVRHLYIPEDSWLDFQSQCDEQFNEYKPRSAVS